MTSYSLSVLLITYLKYGLRFVELKFLIRNYDKGWFFPGIILKVPIVRLELYESLSYSLLITIIIILKHYIDIVLGM